jgi:hypothetical protein
MDAVGSPHDRFLDDLDDLKRRVANLERASRAIVGFTAYLPDEVGDPSYAALEVGEHGLHTPSLNGLVASFGPAAFVQTTSPTFASCYEVTWHQAISDAVRIASVWTTDVGTTGEIRLLNFAVGGAASDPIVLGAGTTGEAIFDWLHQQPLATTEFLIHVQARRTAGAGAITVWNPNRAYLVPEFAFGATESGT